MPHAFGDVRLIPLVTILLFKWHKLATATDSRASTSVVQEHKREETANLRLARQQLIQHTAQADRLCREIFSHEVLAGSRGIALIEDEIDDGKDGVEALVQSI
jgi:hypothetical protein